jgi:hypothetical protein
MKAKGKSGNGVAQRRLIERLAPSRGQGALLGMLATSYEFQPEFFETDFLPTVLDLGAWDDRSWTSRIAVEKKLAEMEAATIFVDARRYSGRPRSLRVAVTPVELPAGAALHAKIVLLVHAGAVRLHVASANVTDPGYRRNREVAAPLIATKAEVTSLSLLESALEGLRQALAKWWTPSAETVVKLAEERLARWRTTERTDEDASFLWSHDGATAWHELVRRWPSGEVLDDIAIVSPFWSEEHGDTGPLARLVGHLRSVGAVGSTTRVRLLTEAKNVGPGKFLPMLPESYREFDARRLGVAATAHAVDPAVTKDEIEVEGVLLTRPLHAKVILLEGPSTAVAYLGSANFSHRAWGFLSDGAPCNVEAGLVLARRGASRTELRALLPATTGEAVSLAGAAHGHLALLDEEKPDPPWPGFLRELLLAPHPTREGHLILEVVVASVEIDGAWSLQLHGDGGASGELLLDVPARPSQDRLLVDLSPSHLAQLLHEQQVRVRWWASDVERDFPINVAPAARDALPVAPGAGRVGESLLIAYYQGRIAFEDLFPEPTGGGPGHHDCEGASDASGVDTSRIQSYVIREFVEALKGIRDDLRQAAKATPPAMRLALHGAVSRSRLRVPSRSKSPRAAARRRRGRSSTWRSWAACSRHAHTRSPPTIGRRGARRSIAPSVPSRSCWLRRGTRRPSCSPRRARSGSTRRRCAATTSSARRRRRDQAFPRCGPWPRSHAHEGRARRRQAARDRRGAARAAVRQRRPATMGDPDPRRRGGARKDLRRPRRSVRSARAHALGEG